MIAIVLAGGKHQVVSESNPETPLALLSMAGEPVISWITKWLMQQGCQHIVFSAGYGADKMAAWASHISSQESNLFIDVVTESRPLGTAGAAAYCLRRYPTRYVLIVNGDSLLLTNLKPAIHTLKHNPQLDGIIVGAQITNAGRFGHLECDAQNRLIGFHEKQSGNGLINAGVYLLQSQLLENIQSDKMVSLEYDCFPQWLKQNKQIDVLPSADPFIDMGTPEALKNAEQQILRYRSRLENDCEKIA